MTDPPHVLPAPWALPADAPDPEGASLDVGAKDPPTPDQAPLRFAAAPASAHMA